VRYIGVGRIVLYWKSKHTSTLQAVKQDGWLAAHRYRYQ
jgi:hypothetical protein